MSALEIIVRALTALLFACLGLGLFVGILSSAIERLREDVLEGVGGIYSAVCVGLLRAAEEASRVAAKIRMTDEDAADWIAVRVLMDFCDRLTALAEGDATSLDEWFLWWSRSGRRPSDEDYA